MNRRLLAFASLVPFAYSMYAAQAKTLWQIGKNDQSSIEYKAKPQDSLRYEADSGAWEKEWPGFQRPGSSYTIDFNLVPSSTGSYKLTISLIMYEPRIPALKLTVNNHHGNFYLRPKVSYYLGDQRSIFDPHYSSQTLEIDIPREYLKQGVNSITIGSVDAQSLQPTADKMSGWHYDAITLSSESKASNEDVSSRVDPTIFYRMKEGHLVERVEAIVRYRNSKPEGTATLEIDGHLYSGEIKSDGDFGEALVQLDVPEWKGIAPGRFRINGKKKYTVRVGLTAARKWTVFVVPHTHVDIGYTDYQGKVAEAQARTLDEAADLVKKFPDFRFTTDGSWNLEQYLATRSETRQKEVLDLIKQNKIGLPAQYVNLLTGYASLETLYRSLYYSKELSRKYGVPFNYANTTDVPTYTGAYPSVLASSGIKYWVVGGNNDRAPILSHEAWNEKSPFWWKGPDGKKVLFWYSRCYEQVMFLFGLPPEQDAVYESLPVFLQAYSRPEYKPDVALVYGTQAENTDLVPGTATFATEWDKNYEYPKLTYATFNDFFKYIDTHYSDDLPTYQGDMSGYWEDGIGSDAYYVSQDRENQNDLISAEVVSTVSHNVDPNLHMPKEELQAAWKNVLLFGEHTWASWNSVMQPKSDEAVKQLATKDNYAVQAAEQIKDLTDRSLSQLVNNIHVPSKTLVVFNSLGWKRDAVIETDVESGQELADWTTGEAVPMEVVSEAHGLMRVRFLAKDLPSVGYRIYRMQEGKSPNAVSNTPQNMTAENQFYRITVDPQSGALQSIFDKQMQRELVDVHSPYKFGQYLYVTGGDGQTRLINPFKSLPQGELTIHKAGQGKLIGMKETPWGFSIETQSADVNTPSVKLEIRLFNREKKIEFSFEVDKTYTTTKEAVYFAFPVAASTPKFLYASHQGWIDPAKDIFKGGSLEWLNIQSWMAVQDKNATVAIVPIDAPLASFGDIFRGHWVGEFKPQNGTMFSYAMNNYWHTNYRAGQGGQFRFRYVMTSADNFDPVALTRLGMESLRQPVQDHVVDQDKAENFERPLSPDGTSFLDIDSPNVALVSWKLAEDGNGTILRLLETAGRQTNAVIKLPHSKVNSAALCNGVEDTLRDIPVSDGMIGVKLQPNEVVTLRLTRSGNNNELKK